MALVTTSCSVAEDFLYPRGQSTPHNFTLFPSIHTQFCCSQPGTNHHALLHTKTSCTLLSNPWFTNFRMKPVGQSKESNPPGLSGMGFLRWSSLALMTWQQNIYKWLREQLAPKMICVKQKATARQDKRPRTLALRAIDQIEQKDGLSIATVAPFLKCDCWALTSQ